MWFFSSLAFFIIIRYIWTVYTHPVNILCRQAINMNWLSNGKIKDAMGYNNTRFVRGFVEVVVEFESKKIRLLNHNPEIYFSDFIEIEHWLVLQKMARNNANATKVPEITSEQTLPIKKLDFMVNIPDAEWEVLRLQYPILAKWLLDPENYKIAWDDLDNLKKIKYGYVCASEIS